MRKGERGREGERRERREHGEIVNKEDKGCEQETKGDKTAKAT